MANLNDDRLVLAWSGTDVPSHLNVMFSNDGLNWAPENKYIFPGFTTHHSPGLNFQSNAPNGALYIAWTNAGPNTLQIRQSTAGQLDVWTGPGPTGETSNYGVDSHSEQACFSWPGLVPTVI